MAITRAGRGRAGTPIEHLLGRLGTDELRQMCNKSFGPMAVPPSATLDGDKRLVDWLINHPNLIPYRIARMADPPVVYTLSDSDEDSDGLASSILSDRGERAMAAPSSHSRTSPSSPPPPHIAHPTLVRVVQVCLSLVLFILGQVGLALVPVVCQTPPSSPFVTLGTHIVFTSLDPHQVSHPARRCPVSTSAQSFPRRGSQLTDRRPHLVVALHGIRGLETRVILETRPTVSESRYPDHRGVLV